MISSTKLSTPDETEVNILCGHATTVHCTNAQLNKPVSTGGSVHHYTTSVPSSGCGIAVPGSQKMCEEEEGEIRRGI